MNNIVFWAHSYCRSTLQFYSELAKALNKNCLIYTWIDNLDLRTAVGFSNSEFSSLQIQHIGDDIKLAETILMKHKDDYNIFCAYQICPVHQRLIELLIKDDIRYGIISEAPCNMDSYPKRFLKCLFLRYYLPFKLREIINNADFILNCSGYYESTLRTLGWKSSQIISCGYYPPPVPRSRLVERDENNWNNFTILMTGLHQWHRSPWILLRAFEVLKNRGYMPKCYITQSGPYLNKMKNYVEKHNLSNIEFLGFVDISILIQLYETCSVYVGCGNYEPWGMRLNDCLLCGAPIVVNRGMGGVKMVDQYGCGLTFNRNDHIGLANAIESLLDDKYLYLKIAKNTIKGAGAIAPEKAAVEYSNKIKKYIENVL